MANQVVNEILFRAIGLDQLTSMLKTAGASQKELDQVAKDYLKTQKEQDAVTRAFNANLKRDITALKEKAVVTDELNKKLRENGTLAKGSSYSQALGTDPLTRDFMRFQSAMSKEQKFMTTLTKPDDIAAAQVRIQQLERQYGSLGVKIADTAGIARTMFAQDIGPQEYMRVVEAAAKLHQEQGKVGHAFQEVSTKARFSTNQMVQFTAAARNTAESLASGISLQTTLMTQGMQVLGAVMGDDVGLMIKFGAVAAMVAPVIISITRALDIDTRTRQFESNIRLMGQSADLTAYKIMSLSKAMQDMGAGRGESLDALKAIQGNIPGLDQATLDRASKLSVDMSVRFDKDVVKSGEEIVKMLNDVSGSSEQVASKYRGVLSVAQLDQIRMLERQGDSIKAAEILLDALSNKFSGEYAKSTNAFTDALHFVVGAFHQVADRLADPSSDVVGMIARSQERLKQLQNEASKPVTPQLIDPAKTIAILRSTEELSESQKTIIDQIGLMTAAYAQGGAEADRYAVSIGKLVDRFIALRDPLDLARENAADVMRVLSLPVPQRAAEQARISAIRAEERAGRSSTAGDMGDLAYATQRATDIDAINQQTAALRRQSDAELAVARAIRFGANAMSEARAKAAAREADANGQNARAAYEVSLMKDRTQALSALDTEMEKSRQAMELSNRARVVGIDQATTEMRLKQMVTGGVNNETESRAKLAAILANEIELRRRAADVELSAERARIGLISNDNLTTGDRAYREAMTGPEAQRAAGQMGDADFALAQERANLARQRANAEAGRSIRDVLEPQVKLQQRLAEIQQASGINEQQRVIMRRQAETEYQDALIKRMEMEDDWLSGMEHGWLKYKQSVGDWSDQMEGFVTRAFGHMEDAFVQMAMTGKMNFADLANAIIADLIRIQIRMQMTSAMESVGGFAGIGGFFANLFGGGGGSNPVNTNDTTTWVSPGTVTSSPLAHGGAFGADSNVIPFARGGSFTNAVVNGNTPFRFGSGGAFSGVMGEAGPEAVVPLTRTAQGDLGVRSIGGGAQVKVEVIDQRGSGAAPIDVETQMGAFGPIVRIIARDEAQKAVNGYAKGGGLNTDLRQNYGIKQPAVSRG
jgi:lambda family phage tail tape measure protein